MTTNTADVLAEAIDAVADALNAWDQGERPRPDTHRHWLRMVAELERLRAVEAAARMMLNGATSEQARYRNLRAALTAKPSPSEGEGP